ncbi:MAG: bifunctional prephenate dehydrogenase/3-phosphoshikimate 1-carboxyvinyltransferase [Pseudohongiellaceae bacterium]
MSSFADLRVLIVGLGLIGGSIARGLRAASPTQTLLAVDADDEALTQALKQGVISEIGSVEDLAPEADLVVLALPPRAAVKALAGIARSCREDTVVTDVASVKSAIVAAVNREAPGFGRRFVPGHPIAGSEQSGFAAASESLFSGRKVILTPQAGTDPLAVARVNQLWRLLGAEVLGMSVARHDEVLAATSHLPHLLAFAVVEALQEQQASADIFRYAAGGFADFSRLASSDARMWSDIFLSNSEAVLAILGAYRDTLEALRVDIEQADEAALLRKFQQAKQTRDRFMQHYFIAGKTQAVNEKALSYEVSPGGEVSGSIRVPGDKSISHRTVIFGALADGVSEISGFLQGEDALNTVAAFREMGVTISGPEDGRMTIYGVGLNGLQAPRKPLYMGNSGTAMRLMAGLLAAQPFASELAGDESLSKRPMNRVAEPLRAMGAQIETGPGGTPPLLLQGASLHGIKYTMPVASAQVKSCLLLAGLYADGETEVTEPAPTRDHTERMLQGFGYPLRRSGATVAISAGHRLTAARVDVPADISSAAFFLVAASITPGASLRLEHVGVNPTRIGVINILRAMGAAIEIENEREAGGEPVADLLVRAAPLKGIVIPAEQIPLAIDEFPVLFVAAACAEGDTVLRGAEELRVKESDRLEAMATGLTTLGIDVESYADGIRISGGQLGGGEIDSRGDHRIAMAFTVAGLRANDTIIVRDCANVATSFPGFVELACRAGMRITRIEG